MPEVWFRADTEPTGKKGHIHLVMVPEALDEETPDPWRVEQEIKDVADILRKKRDWEEKNPGRRYLLRVKFEVWYRRRSPSAWNLYAELAQRLALANNQTWQESHTALKWRYYPREGEIGRKVLKSSKDLSSLEIHRVIEGAVYECLTNDPPVDIRDIWTLWQQNRHKEKDPLEGDYANMDDYVDRHPVCECCGRGLLNDDAGREGQLDHIVPQGEGGPDDDWNRLRDCTECHMMVRHPGGLLVLISRYSHVAGKVNKALERCGKPVLAEKAARSGIDKYAGKPEIF